MSATKLQWVTWVTCSCGKRGYHTRRDAKRVARRSHRGEPGMHAYQCLTDPAFFHLGHLSDRVRHGEVDRSVYQNARPA